MLGWRSGGGSTGSAGQASGDEQVFGAYARGRVGDANICSIALDDERVFVVAVRRGGTVVRRTAVLAHRVGPSRAGVVGSPTRRGSGRTVPVTPPRETAPHGCLLHPSPSHRVTPLADPVARLVRPRARLARSRRVARRPDRVDRPGPLGRCCRRRRPRRLPPRAGWSSAWSSWRASLVRGAGARSARRRRGRRRRTAAAAPPAAAGDRRGPPAAADGLRRAAGRHRCGRSPRRCGPTATSARSSTSSPTGPAVRRSRPAQRIALDGLAVTGTRRGAGTRRVAVVGRAGGSQPSTPAASVADVRCPSCAPATTTRSSTRARPTTAAPSVAGASASRCGHRFTTFERLEEAAARRREALGRSRAVRSRRRSRPASSPAAKGRPVTVEQIGLRRRRDRGRAAPRGARGHHRADRPGGARAAPRARRGRLRALRQRLQGLRRAPPTSSASSACSPRPPRPSATDRRGARWRLRSSRRSRRHVAEEHARPRRATRSSRSRSGWMHGAAPHDPRGSSPLTSSGRHRQAQLVDQPRSSQELAVERRAALAQHHRGAASGRALTSAAGVDTVASPALDHVGHGSSARRGGRDRRPGSVNTSGRWAGRRRGGPPGRGRGGRSPRRRRERRLARAALARRWIVGARARWAVALGPHRAGRRRAMTSASARRARKIGLVARAAEAARPPVDRDGAVDAGDHVDGHPGPIGAARALVPAVRVGGVDIGHLGGQELAHGLKASPAGRERGRSAIVPMWLRTTVGRAVDHRWSTRTTWPSAILAPAFQRTQTVLRGSGRDIDRTQVGAA